MAAQAPSSFNQHIFFEAKSVFYGTDDGYQDGSCTEFQLLRGFLPERQERSGAKRFTSSVPSADSTD